jgi:hypothetical protein
MSFYSGLLQKVWGAPAQPPPQQMPEVRIPQFVKDNVYLTVSGGLALVRGPKPLLLGAVSALFCRLVQNGSIPSQHKPLVEHALKVIQPVLDHPTTVADMVAFSALMMFDDFAPMTSWWIGLTAALLILPQTRQD